MIYIYSIGDNMKLQQLREIILNCKYVVEVHENDFKVMNDYVLINDIITLHDITRIDIVGADETDDTDGVTVWFNNHRIDLVNIKSLRISETISCL